MRITEEALAWRKNRLIHVAYDLFCEYGIDAVTVLQISKKSEISVNSIYCYFNSKAMLVQHTQKILWEEILEHILSDSRQELANTINGYEEMKILLFNFKSFYENYSHYLLFSCDYRLFLIRHGLKLSEEFYKEIHMPIYKPFIAALQRGQNDGSISTGETPQTQFIAVWGVMYSFVEKIVVFDKMYEGKNPWKEHLDLVITHLMLGLKSKTKSSN